MIRSIEASEKPSNPNGEQTRRGELMSQMSAVSEAGESPALVTRRVRICTGTQAQPGGPGAGILSSPDETSCGSGASRDRHSVFSPQEGT